MRSLPRRRIVGTLLALCLPLVGCSKTPTEAPVTSVASTRPVPPPSPAGTGSGTSQSQPKPQSRPSGGKTSSLVANVDPRFLFVVSGPGQLVEVDADPPVSPANKFEVTSADQLYDSTQFVVNATPSQSLSGGTAVERKAGFTLPPGFEEVREYGFTPEGYPQRILCTKNGTQLACVPAGPAIVGSDSGPDVSRPSITVELDTYYMQVLEVTVQDFERYRVEMREKKKTVPPAPLNASSPPQLPALGLPWGIAVNYAKWAGMELPTEAEFEKAARGTHGLRTPWGDGRPLWAERTISATGIFAADRSPYGIYDLAGNASEWCADLYSATAHEEAVNSISKDSLKNWSGPKKVRDMNLRVVKGNGENWSIWHRTGKDMGKAHGDVGFRCVLRIPRSTK
ncbi:formylglycine-generating enzyme family protein [Schlesneria sp. DSM 10557]|uniref:formylglycine-generating enzyme family protein n=1 Tax=Schlesneria sp. DSM 10557 TaxID=3044399 RepID=UPI00359F9A8A